MEPPGRLQALCKDKRKKATRRMDKPAGRFVFCEVVGVHAAFFGGSLRYFYPPTGGGFSLLRKSEKHAADRMRRGMALLRPLPRGRQARGGGLCRRRLIGYVILDPLYADGGAGAAGRKEGVHLA